MKNKRMARRVTSFLLVFTLLIGLFPSTIQGTKIAKAAETITITPENATSADNKLTQTSHKDFSLKPL